MFAVIWIFLLGMRECFNIFNLPTEFFTIAITSMQFLNLLFLLKKTRWKLTIYHIVLFVLILLIFVNTDTVATVNIIFAVILLKNENLKKICLTVCAAYLINIIIILFGYSYGILQDSITVYQKGITHTLGFQNSNTPGLYAMQCSLVFATTWLLFSDFKLVLLFLIVPNYLIFKYTLGRTSFLCICLFLLFVFYFSMDRKYMFTRKYSFLVPFFFFILIFFVAFSIKFMPPLYAVGNAIFTGRPRMIYKILSKMNPANFLLGYKNIDMPMDCAYLGILVNGGIFSLFLFFSCCYKGLKNIPLNMAKRMLPFIFVILISGVTEGTFSLFRLSTIVFYKVLIDRFDFNYIKSKYFFKVR